MLKPKTLRARLILLTLLTLFLVQFVSILVYLKDRNHLINSASSSLLGQRIVALVRLMDQSEPFQYEAILKATENPQLAVLISQEPLISLGSVKGPAADMQEKLYRKTQRQPEQSIRVTYERYPVPDDFECEMGEFEGLGKAGRYFQGSGHAYWQNKKGSWEDGSYAESYDGYGHDRRDKHDYSRGFNRFKGENWRPYEMTVSILLANNYWLNIRAGNTDELPVWNWRSAVSLLVIGILVIGLMLWLLRSNTRPLQKLAQAANNIGRGIDAPPLKEEGAEEVRSTIQAFNRMQERQQRFIKDRVLMLAAISHDLKTPITKLRLQSEFVTDQEIQGKMFSTLSEMESMLNATMNFARDDVQSEESRPTDLASLVQSLCDDLTDNGAHIEVDLPLRLVCECRPVGMRRMISNVLENAVKYADSAKVKLESTTETGGCNKSIILTVIDDGPGIDESLFEQVFTPFYRVEGSRNRSTGGMGLGLSVVRSIALLHGGQVTLQNESKGGLKVTISIPC